MQFDWERQRRVKRDDLCAFPQTLDVEHFVDAEYATDVGPTAYELIAVLIQSGTAYSGHYFAYIKSGDKSWWEFNDEKVTELAADDHDPSFLQRVFGGAASAEGRASSLTAYGLMYRRVGSGAGLPEAVCHVLLS